MNSAAYHNKIGPNIQKMGFFFFLGPGFGGVSPSAFMIVDSISLTKK